MWIDDQNFLRQWLEIFSHLIDGSSISTIGLTIEFGQGKFFKFNQFWCLKFFNRQIGWPKKFDYCPIFFYCPRKFRLSPKMLFWLLPKKNKMINNGLISTIHYYKTWFFKRFNLTNWSFFINGHVHFD